MKKDLHSRIIIHKILISIKKNLDSYDIAFEKHVKIKKLNIFEKKFIHNTVLTSIRNNFIIKEIIQKYSHKKNINLNQYLILLSGITQLIFLNIKEYAVIDSMVEIAKNKVYKSDYSLTNAILRKIVLNKVNLKKINTNFSLLPQWFKENTKEWNQLTKKEFLTTIKFQPDLHLVFKNNNDLNKFSYKGFNTSKKSISIRNHDKIEDLPEFKNGKWWVQDYAAMLPVSLLSHDSYKSAIDMCAAPGGKSFQLLSKNIDTILYEKNKKRAEILKKNLKRLNLTAKIKIDDALKIDETEKFDLVILDAPCSSVGTLRRHPEIFFRNSIVDVQGYVEIQKKLLNKASKIVKTNGIILYMVCSFLKIETNKQINAFLRKNKNFSLEAFEIKKSELVNKKGLIKTIPKEINNKFLIDGFFAAKILRNE